MTDDFRLEDVNLGRAANVAEIRRFLDRFGLSFDADVSFTVALRDRDDVLVGTGSSQGGVLRNIAVDESLQGAGLTARILSALIQDLSRRGILHYFIFTRPEKSFLFAGLGFTEIARAEPYAALLESGLGSVAAYCDAIAAQTAHLPAERAAIVMNANPFTRGHRALAERAAAENPGLIVFVVQEDRSLFPFADRLRLVREGLADLPGVAVVEGGNYIISAATFPAYFTRQEDLAKAQARLDISLFTRHIAPRLGIRARYAGEEPFCPVTAEYNEAMRDILPSAGITLHIIPRSATGGEAISASAVRALIRANTWENMADLVPPTTLAYLRDPAHAAVLEAIRTANSRH